jgi:hypothetical protein
MRTAPPIRMQYQGENYDLVYSPDDGGWYLQRWSDDKTSEVFVYQEDARNALELDIIDWS